MKKMFSFVLILALVGSVGLPSVPQAQAVTDAELAAHWAPQFYQDVNDSHGYAADYLTNFNYDGDWNGNNNWENLYSYPLKAYVYYSVVETSSHYFIGYWTFHPRDDGPTSADRHENDMEGALLVIKKDGSTYGSFQLMETQAHNQWYQYTNDGNISTGSDDVDGSVLFNGHRPKIFIQANGQSPWNGHGVHAYDGSDAPGGDGIVYDYGGTAEVPTQASGNYQYSYSYDLISIDEIWDRRNQIDGSLFYDWGVFAGDTYENNSAKAPWGWDDPDDGATFTGDIFADPAHIVDTHLNGLGSFSHYYTYNPYYTHKITTTSVTSAEDRDPFGGASDIYIWAVADGERVMDERLWKRNDASKGQSYHVYFGFDDATDGNQYSDYYYHRYLAKPANSTMTLEIYDSDGSSGDDYMGSLSATLSPGTSQSWNNTYTSNGDAQVTATVDAVR